MSKLAKILRARANAWAAQREEEEIARSDLHDDLLQSGIHTSPGRTPQAGTPRRFDKRREHHRSPPLFDDMIDIEAPARAAREVSLIVYGWHNVEPGPLSWVFPSVRAALSAAKAMRNAVRWAIVAGRHQATALDEARATGRVILEHAG
jgi:hypothetical protein